MTQTLNSFKMKKILYLPLLLLFISLNSCKTTHKVGYVEYDHQDGTLNYKNKAEDAVAIDKNEAYVSEGSFVDLKIINYNPIIMDFSIEKLPNKLFYQESNNATLNTFLSLPTTKPKNGPGMSLNEQSDVKTNFYQFYNAVIALNYGMDNLQLLKTFQDDCFCCELDGLLINLENTYIDDVTFNFNELVVNDTIIEKPCEDCYINDLKCIKISTAKMIINQKDKYLEKINESITLLMDNLKDDLSKEDKELISNELKEYNALKEEFLKTYNNVIETIVRRYRMLATLEFQKKFTRLKVEETDEFVVKLTSTNKITQSTSEFNVIDLPVLKVLKIDFSSGLFFTKLYDENYRRTIFDDAGTTKYKLEKLNGGELSYGAMGFINFHTQLRKPVNFGLSIGAGLMFNQATKLVLSPTASLIFGKYQRFILHVGVAFAQVNRIYSAYAPDDFVPSDYIPETKVDVESEFLIGLSYNLTR